VGLFCASSHELFHAGGRQEPTATTDRTGQKPPQRRPDLPWADRDNRSGRCTAESGHGSRRQRCAPQRALRQRLPPALAAPVGADPASPILAAPFGSRSEPNKSRPATMADKTLHRMPLTASLDLGFTQKW